MNNFTETTTISWVSRLKSSLSGLIIGPILIFISIYTLWTNEGNFVAVETGLNESFAQVLEIPAEPLDPSKEGNILYTQGMVKINGLLQDDMFQVSAPAVKLERRVEMYQWDEDTKTETVDNMGGSQTKHKTYSYKNVWSDKPIKSDTFHATANGKVNPTNWKYVSATLKNDHVSIGAYKLSPELLEKFTTATPILPPTSFSGGVGMNPEIVSTGAVMPQLHTRGTYMYYAVNPEIPQVGDLRISFYQTTPKTASVVGKFSNGMLQEFETKQGSRVGLLSEGSVPSKDLFIKAQESNITMTWIIRAIALIVMLVGFNMFFSLIPTLAAFVPFIGNFLHTSVGVIAFLATLILGGCTIAFAWIMARPLYATLAIILIVGIGVIFWKNKKQQPI